MLAIRREQRIEERLEEGRDKARTLEIVSNDLATAISMYEEWVANGINEKTKPILTPKDVNAFLQIAQDNIHPSGSTLLISYFTNDLIKESYKATYNNFQLDIRYPITFFCSSIKGNCENPVKISINGNVGSFVGSDSTHVRLYINGHADEGAVTASQDAAIVIEGDAGTQLAERARNVTAIVKGEMKGISGQLARDCVFGVYDQQTAQSVYRVVQDWNALDNRSNKIFIVDENGWEREYLG